MKKPRPKSGRSRPGDNKVSVQVEGGATAHFPSSTDLPKPAVIAGMQIQNFRQSPFPPAEEAKVYEQLCPGAFDRILQMAKAAQDAQIKAMEREQSYLAADTKRGHWLGACVTFGGFWLHGLAGAARGGDAVFRIAGSQRRQVARRYVARLLSQGKIVCLERAELNAALNPLI